MMPPTSAGVFSSSGRYIPSANVSAGTLTISKMIAIAAPVPKRKYAIGCRFMNPSTIAFMIEACGAARTSRASPGAFSPNWNTRASMTIVSPTAIEAAIAVGLTIVMLARVFQFGEKAPGDAREVLAAPQASIMKAIVEGFMNRQPIAYFLFGTGAAIAIILEMVKVPALTFALGMYPVSYT